MNFSSILEKQDELEIGLYLPKSFSSSPLKIGVTLAILQSSGKIPSSKDNLKICNKGLLKDQKTTINNIETNFIIT